MPNLETLNLSNNVIANFDNNRMQSLLSLDLFNNRLLSFNFTSDPLVTLNISRNSIGNLSGLLYRALKTFLASDNTNLTTFSNNQLTEVLTLDLSRCNVSTF